MSSYTCSCGKILESPLKSTLILDKEISALINSGDIFNVPCSDCDRILKVEEKTDFFSPSKDYHLLFIPENSRTSFFLGKIAIDPSVDRLVIGYKELKEKLLMRENGLDDQILEILKLSYMSRHKKNINLYFKEIQNEKLYFYVEGLKLEEIGLTAISMDLYLQKLQEKLIYLKDDDILSFISPPYVNASQIDVEDEELN